MAAQAERSLHALTHARSREGMLKALYGCIAAIAAAIGVLGLRGASWPRHMLESWINIHALFGLLLCGLVLARCRWCIAYSRPMPADIRGLSRHLSRIVYLLLYLVVGVREVIGIFNSHWHGGTVDFNLFDERLRNGPDYAGFNLKDDFQLFLASGLFALIFVRILAFRLRWRSEEGAAGSKAATGANAKPTSSNLERSDR
jgi:cytochrome b561